MSEDSAFEVKRSEFCREILPTLAWQRVGESGVPVGTAGAVGSESAALDLVDDVAEGRVGVGRTWET